MVRRRPRPHRAGSAPLLPRVGLLHEGRDPLTTGCAYCTKAPPTRSTPNPHPVAPHPRAVRPNDASRHPSSCEQPGRPHQRSEQWLPHTVGPPHQRLEMPRHPKLPEDMRQHRGFRVRTRGACSRAGPEAMVQRPVPGPDPSSRSESTNVHEDGAELVKGRAYRAVPRQAFQPRARMSCGNTA